MKTYEQIMDDINGSIMANPNALQSEIEHLQVQIDQIDIEIISQERNLTQYGPISDNFQVEYEIWDTPLSKGLKFVEFDQNGNVIRILGKNQARDFRRT